VQQGQDTHTNNIRTITRRRHLRFEAENAFVANSACDGKKQKQKCPTKARNIEAKHCNRQTEDGPTETKHSNGPW